MCERIVLSGAQAAGGSARAAPVWVWQVSTGNAQLRVACSVPSSPHGSETGGTAWWARLLCSVCACIEACSYQPAAFSRAAQRSACWRWGGGGRINPNVPPTVCIGWCHWWAGSAPECRRGACCSAARCPPGAGGCGVVAPVACVRCVVRWVRVCGNRVPCVINGR